VAAIRTSTDRYVQTALAAEWDAWAALTTDDAVFLQPNGAAVEGRHAIRKWATAFTGLTRFSANVLAVEGRDDIAISRGTYSFVLGPEDGLPVADTGKFLTVWRRQPGGTWLISRNMWNSDRPALVLRVASSH
jgi:ketosteroid isomerase-like protein